ncbi:MAG TPA: patatin-like phospholipase RssA [Leptospiraceae bacterium]|nr:patatin-like phospholipase RssA [Leptospiraceae bacterium]HMW04809.1 patatin-like phospholipase RssA [Leptospiraceae bacterium]HMX35225.1 patatin-like phospholipase RssA [Leptospiraceae bacterium]HMY33523.1 patatin-like phospholipase RssA [Leptospiraceae bacterium]HMZ66110.1 patatin-like phospholipase RssA [Leptospiraceae bacterium]
MIVKNGKNLKLGLALGSGSSRGWAHIGVIRRLEELGIKPDVVVGTSVGSLVGAAYCAGKLTDLESWLVSLKWQDVVSFFDLSFAGGLIKGNKLFKFFESHFQDTKIEDLQIPFGAVATDLETGQEIWMRSESLLSAVRASISLPGIFSPARRDNRWLVDGGMVNPVPVSLCRAMGAEFIIAVDLNAYLLDPIQKLEQEKKEVKEEETKSKWSFMDSFIKKSSPKEETESIKEETEGKPSMMEVINRSINIMEVKITRSRMAGDPADITLAPRLSHINMLEFHRASECIEEGKRVVKLIEDFLK